MDALARMPPKIARLVGLTSSDPQSRGNGGGGSFALEGGVFVGGDTRGGTEMTTPEVLRSTRYCTSWGCVFWAGRRAY